MKSILLFTSLVFAGAAHARVQQYPEPQVPGERGQCYETSNCDNEGHAAMLLPLEHCGRLMKHAGEKAASWKMLGSQMCVRIDLDTVQE